MRWPIAADHELVQLLRELVVFRTAEATTRFDAQLLERAERHGVAGLVHDAAVASGVVLDARFARMRIARELDHEAHLAMLHTIDATGLQAVVLKGALLAERLYPGPTARSTTDIDLLVVPEDVARATAALATVGYVLVDDAAEQARATREHHHFHLAHPHGPQLELHFHAYRGFGETLFAAPLVERARDAQGFTSLRVLEPADELLFLSVHAAAHRFVRLAWLCDLSFLVARVTAAEIQTAATRAQQLGYARALAMTAALLVELLGANESALLPMRRRDPGRDELLRWTVGEPPGQLVRSAMRFVYTAAMCDSPSATGRFMAEAAARRWKSAFR